MLYLQLIAGPEGESWCKPAQSELLIRASDQATATFRAVRRRKDPAPLFWWSRVLIAVIAQGIDREGGKQSGGREVFVHIWFFVCNK